MNGLNEIERFHRRFTKYLLFKYYIKFNSGLFFNLYVLANATHGMLNSEYRHHCSLTDKTKSSASRPATATTIMLLPSTVLSQPSS